MAEMTIESLSQRVAELERKVAELTTARAESINDWRRTVGMFQGDDFSRAVDAEALAIREADRRAAREGAAE